ncbi:MAG TPA: hypothetical protein VF141_11950 [Chryseolinea sp.]
MLIPTNLPLYFKCCFFDKKNKKMVCIYRIESTGNQVHPFQLLKRIADGPMGWMHLSIYASVHDSLSILLQELFTGELSEEIYRGHASIDAAAILEKLDNGERTVAIYDKTGNQAFRLEFDVAVKDLVHRDTRPRLQKRSRKIGVRIG